MKKWLIVLAVGALAPVAALAQTPRCVDPNSPCYPKCGGEVNISGATLFQPWFLAPASTNDFNDVDCDGVASPSIDQLANIGSVGVPLPPSYWWAVQYRATGSGNGLAEFVRSHLQGPYYGAGPQWFPNCADASPLVVNRQTFTCPSPYVYAEEQHIAVMDVPTTWFVTQSGTPAWNRRPTTAGYGNNPQLTWNAAISSQSNKLKSLSHPTDPNTYGRLNLNIASPDDHTVFDNPIAWVIIGVISNRGVGVGLGPDGHGPGNINASELQYLFTTGRMPNGENLNAATRDSGSGTRNGAMNSLCIDPSYGRGDNLNKKTEETVSTTDNLGPYFQYTNMGGSSRMEAAVQNNRLAIGYTGCLGSGRAFDDVAAGNYELLSVKFDNRGGTVFTRPSKVNSFNNSYVSITLDPNDPTNPSKNIVANPNAYTLGGDETFATVGDPRLPGSAAPAMREGPAKDYLNNVLDSITNFVDVPGDPENNGSPGELLAYSFTLTGAIDNSPNYGGDTCNFVQNPNLNLTLRNWMIANNTGFVKLRNYDDPGYGAKAPTRVNNPTPWRRSSNDPNVLADPNLPYEANECDCAYPPNGFYSDGTNGTQGYKNRQGGSNVAYGANLKVVAPRNLLVGDFNGDGLRNINDIIGDTLDPNSPNFGKGGLMQAILDPAAYCAYDQSKGRSSGTNPVIPELIGDFNADGNFDCRDVRFFADGLALDPVTGDLNRGQAFLLVDLVWAKLTGGDNNFFNTTIVDCNGNVLPYVPGAAAADIAGHTAWKGARPNGYDCVVNCTDLAYVAANVGDWHVLTDAQTIDLSADMNGDLVVGCDDFNFVKALLGNCECLGVESPCAPALCPGDMNCDGTVDFADIDPFVLALSGEQAYLAQFPNCHWLNGDANGDNTVDFADIDPFVGLLFTTCP